MLAMLRPKGVTRPKIFRSDSIKLENKTLLLVATVIICQSVPTSPDVLVSIETQIQNGASSMMIDHPLQRFLSSWKGKVVLQNFGTKSISQLLKYLAIVSEDKILSKT